MPNSQQARHVFGNKKREYQEGEDVLDLEDDNDSDTQ